MQNSQLSGFLCLLFSCSLISYFKQALKSDFFFVFFSLGGKTIRFSAKNSGIVNESHYFEPIELQGSPVISKWM